MVNWKGVNWNQMRIENLIEENQPSFEPYTVTIKYQRNLLDNLAAKPRGMTGKVKPQMTNQTF